MMTDVIYMGRTVEYDDSVVIEFELFVGSEQNAETIVETVKDHSFSHKVKSWEGWRVVEHTASLQLSFSKPVIDSSPQHFLVTGGGCMLLTLLVTCAISKGARQLKKSMKNNSKKHVPITVMDLFQFEATVETIDEELRDLTDEI
jgi:hypothetical protein